MATAALTGATGLLGANLARTLLDAGHRVRATRRRTSSAKHLDGFAIDWVEADLGDAQALSEAFTGADVVFHLAAQVSVLPKPTPELVAANVDGTRNVLTAVRTAKVPRLVHCSTVGAVGLTDDGAPCTEESPWNFAERGMDDGYVTTKRRAEDLVRDAAEAGLDAVICNPTYMFGPYDVRPSSGKMIVDIVKRKVPGYTTGSNNFVDVRDVARGFVLAWKKGKPGERYILGGQNLTYRQAFDLIAGVAGVKPPGTAVPRILATTFGWVGDIRTWIDGKEPFLNSVAVRYGFCNDFIFSSAKAQRELGYTSGPLEPAVRDAIGWFRGAGMLRP